MAVLKPLAVAINWIERVGVFALVFVVATLVAFTLFLSGMPPAMIMIAMGECAIIGACLGRAASGKRAGPSPTPTPYGTRAPRNLASAKIAILSEITEHAEHE